MTGHNNTGHGDAPGSDSGWVWQWGVEQVQHGGDGSGRSFNGRGEGLGEGSPAGTGRSHRLITSSERVCKWCIAPESEHALPHDHYTLPVAVPGLCEATNPGGVYGHGWQNCRCGAMVHTDSRFHVCLVLADGRRLPSRKPSVTQHSGWTVKSQWNGYRWEAWFPDNANTWMWFSDTTELEAVQGLLSTMESEE